MTKTEYMKTFGEVLASQYMHGTIDGRQAYRLMYAAARRLGRNSDHYAKTAREAYKQLIWDYNRKHATTYSAECYAQRGTRRGS